MGACSGWECVVLSGLGTAERKTWSSACRILTLRCRGAGMTSGLAVAMLEGHFVVWPAMTCEEGAGATNIPVPVLWAPEVWRDEEARCTIVTRVDES